ncbi:hypothetical protein G7062_08030 [Erysipelothrix sp. HDW6C]|uniref:hypothetical protein n=1 Tax=Erysipelothrix sp. HDW6C TaxID=2714930 RepID=UPI00140AF1DF|nr:hypothetical protein [Erysipelothrix sp. HDW6C]QIK70241.1 hypothetical protein G7062_08030 [Erysipelothrix sp. HDW6C]
MVILRNCDFEDVWIKEIEPFKNNDNLYRTMKDINSRILIENVNSHQWKFEIVEEFYANGSAFYTIMAGETDKRKWYFIKVYFKTLQYYWNDITYDKPF